MKVPSSILLIHYIAISDTQVSASQQSVKPFFVILVVT